VVRIDEATGLALVRVVGPKLAFFELGDGEAGKIMCAAFPEVDIFAPTGEMVSGIATIPAKFWVIRLIKHPRLAGSPLFQNGKVVGVVMATRDSEMNAIPAVPAAAVKALLGEDAPKEKGLNPDPLTALMQISVTKERTQE
jgi:hypothetical protein